jgi:hypothetical protein
MRVISEEASEGGWFVYSELRMFLDAVSHRFSTLVSLGRGVVTEKLCFP